MPDPFPDHPTYPVEPAVFDQIEAVALAVVELQSTLARLEPHYRFLALMTVGDELIDLYGMVYEAARQFEAHGLKDLGGQFSTRPATELEVRQARQGRWR